MINFNNLKEVFLFLLLFVCLTSKGQIKIFDQNTEWYYHDQGDLSENWHLFKKNVNWKKGISPLGYGDKEIKTIINFGKDEFNKDITKYFYKEFFLENYKTFLAFEIRALIDDGAIIYINNKQVYRSNMPNTSITASTKALSTVWGENEIKIHSKIIESNFFREGKNTIAVSIHQADIESSDCLFDLGLVGYKNSNALTELINSKNNDVDVNIEKKINSLVLENNAIQIDNLKQTNSNLKFILFVIIFLLALTIISCIVIVDNYKKKTKTLDTTIADLKKEEVLKNQKLLTLSNKVLLNKQYYKEIRADLKSLQTNDSSIIKSIMRVIDTAINQEEEWEALEYHFKALYQNFYNKLLEKHPNLTETELRHCMFIKLHLQTKEIAKIMLIDPRSVQTTRYRLKKKMDLAEEIDLRNYLNNI